MKKSKRESEGVLIKAVLFSVFFLISILIFSSGASATEWNYTGTSYDTSMYGPAMSIKWVDYDWWVLINNRAYLFLPDFTSTGVYYDLSTQDSSTASIEWDGSNWWMLGANNRKVYNYSSSWVYTGINYSVISQDNQPKEIEWEGDYWWMLGSQNDRVYKYYPNWTYTGISYNLSSQTIYPTSIRKEGNYWFVLTSVPMFNPSVLKYYSNWTYTGTSYTNGEDVGSQSIDTAMGYWWMAGSGNQAIFKYEGAPSPLYGHSASNVFPGNFSSGNYRFPLGTLLVTNSNPSSIALIGNSSGNGKVIGVSGSAEGSSGYGVHGSGFYGVYGISNSSLGSGVQGNATSASGDTSGVYGYSISNSTGYGVYGSATASTGINYGVYGTSSSSSGRGIFGGAATSSSSFPHYGVYGASNSSSGIGVYGIGNSSGARGHGVYGVSGYSNLTKGKGVFGNHSGIVSGWGVYAYGSGSNFVSNTAALRVEGNSVVQGLTSGNCQQIAFRTASGSQEVSIPYSCRYFSGCYVILYENEPGTPNLDGAYYHQRYTTITTEPMVSFGAYYGAITDLNGDTSSVAFARTSGGDCSLWTGNSGSGYDKTEWELYNTADSGCNCTLVVCE